MIQPRCCFPIGHHHLHSLNSVISGCNFGNANFKHTVNDVYSIFHQTASKWMWPHWWGVLRPRQYGCLDVFRFIFLHEICCILNKIELIHIMAWHQNGQAIIRTNRPNLRDLIAATGLIFLLKLDSSAQFFSPCDLEICSMTSKNDRVPLLY